MKRIIRTSLALLLVLLCVTGSALAAAADTPEKLTIACSNVGGLPIPALFAPEHKIVPRAEKLLGRMLNANGADIVCVQEDFQYHDLLAKQMTDYPYRTFTSGGIPAGDGLNVFSKYPIYNVERVTWTTFNGILKYDNDGLTPKGFLKCTVDAGGVLIDLYNIHTDASRAEADQLAKRAQFEQLAAYIHAHSQDRPILITGDFNCSLHTYLLSNFYEIMLRDEGFTDAWVEVVNGGDCLHGDDADERIAAYTAQYGETFKGYWDSYERLLSRDGDGVHFTPTEHTYTFYTDKLNRPQALTDHAVMECTVELDAADYVRPETQLQPPTDRKWTEKLTHSLQMVARCLKLIFTDLTDWIFRGKPLQ